MLYTMNRLKREEDQSNNSVLNQFKTKYIGLKNSVDELYNLVLWLMNWANDLADRLSKIRTDMYEDLWDVQDDARDGKIKDTFTFSQIKTLIESAEDDLGNITGELEDVLGCLHACQTCDTACDALVAGPNDNFCNNYDGTETCFSLSACSYDTPVCDDSDEPPCDYTDEPTCNDTVDCNGNDTITVIVPCDNNKTCPSCYGSTVTTETETKVTCTSCDAGNCTGNCVDEVGCDQSLSGVTSDLREFCTDGGWKNLENVCLWVDDARLNFAATTSCELGNNILNNNQTRSCKEGPYIATGIDSPCHYIRTLNNLDNVLACCSPYITADSNCTPNVTELDTGTAYVKLYTECDGNDSYLPCSATIAINQSDSCIVEGADKTVSDKGITYACDTSISYRVDSEGVLHIVADSCEPSYTNPTVSCDNPATEHTEETETTEKQVCTGGASLDSVDYTEGDDIVSTISMNDLIALCSQQALANECNPEFGSCSNAGALQDKCNQAACNQGAGSAGCGGEVSCGYSPCTGCFGYTAPCSECSTCFVSGGGSYGGCALCYGASQCSHVTCDGHCQSGESGTCVTNN